MKLYNTDESPNNWRLSPSTHHSKLAGKARGQNLGTSLGFSSFLAIGLMTLMLMTGCENGGGDSDSNSEEDNEGPQDSLTLNGHVAYGRPAAFAQVCAHNIANNQTEEICTRASQYGRYDLEALNESLGLSQASYIDHEGQELQLHGIFQITTGATNAVSNLNPVTDLMTQAWFAAQMDTTTAAECYGTLACMTEFSADFQPDHLTAIRNGLVTLLGELWPVDEDTGEPVDPFTEDYDYNPSDDPINMDGLIELVDFNVDAEGLLTVTDIFDNEIASVPLDHLINGDEDSFLTSVPVDVVDSTEAQTTQTTIDFDTFSPPTSIIAVNVAIQTNGPGPHESPVNVAITVIPTHLGNPPVPIVGWQAELLAPSGAITAWSNLEVPTGAYSTLLEEVGTWQVSAIATDQNGLMGVGGAAIVVGRGEDTLVDATFGQSGSCQPNWFQFDQNTVNRCVELLDGGNQGLPECEQDYDQLIHHEGRCRITWQFQDSTLDRYEPEEEQLYQNQAIFLGHCSSVETETRTYHYINPLRNTGETVAESQARLDLHCAADLGFWLNGEEATND